MFLDTQDIDISVCGDSTLFIFEIAILVIRIIQVLVPFALIIWGSLDFFKALIAGDEKDIKQKRKPFISRVVAALIILLLPMLVSLIINTIANNYPATSMFTDCWTEAEKVVKSGKIKLPKSGSNIQ